MAKSERVLFVGTTDGLYYVDEEDGEFEANLAGFKGKGTMRAPVKVDVDDPKRLYAGTVKTGMWSSDDFGSTWREMNQGIVYKELWSIQQHPKTKTLWVGTAPADIFRSDDRGDTWVEQEKLLTLKTTREWHGPAAPHVSRMKFLALDPTDPDKIYGAIEEGWCVRSLDGGQTWDQLNDGTDHDSHTIYVMPDNPSTVISTGGKGVFRSEDRGMTWVEGKGLEDYLYTPAYLVVNPSNPNLLFTTTTATGPGGWTKPEGPGLAFARSEDQGRSWDVIDGAVPSDFRPVPRGFVNDPQNPEVFFAGMTDGSIWMSKDSCEHFEQVVNGLPPVSGMGIGYR